MKVDRDRFMDEGYLILRDFLSPTRLESLRATYETILDRQKVIWARERGPDDPPGGVWETAQQPRLDLTQSGLIDEETVNAIEDFWVHDATMDVASHLLSTSKPNVHSMSMMCNPVRDHTGGTGWHRDVSPILTAPLKALQADFMENGARYTQWNAPLYDDNVLWIVPRGHRRVNTDEENHSLRQDKKKPVPTGVPVELKAGDAVVYTHYLLHTGSDYTTKLRRTLHGGHERMTEPATHEFTEVLAPWAREIFECATRKGEELLNITESTLRAVITGDASAYRVGLESLEPGIGEHGKTVFTIYLCHAALFLKIQKDPTFDAPDLAKMSASRSHPLTLNWGPEFADRFSDAEVDALWRRFQALDALLQGDEERLAPGFQGAPTRYIVNDTPNGADTESFIASWTNGA